jgi:predicted nuclease of predicted toxin-antitoxin system
VRIFVDENIPTRTVRSLRAMGHEVSDVRGTPDEAVNDDDLWRLVQQERALLVTTDKGFVRHRDDPHSGILIVRLRRPNRIKIDERVVQALQRFDENQWPGLLVVMRDRVQSVRRTRAQEE